MRQGLVMATLVACAGPSPVGRDGDPTPADGDLESEVSETSDTACDSVPAAVDALALEASRFKNNALGRALTVELSAPAPAEVTCTLEEAPPVWRQLVPLNATWRWSETEPGAGFAAPSYEDAAWPSGRAPFGRETEAAATFVAPESDVPIAVIWFRTAFEIADPGAIRSLVAAIRRDDGVVLYLNGTEVVRDNVPATGLTVSDDERFLFPFDLDPALLVPGTNVLAAEVHQYDDSIDLGFAVRLAAEVDELLPETHVLHSTTPSATHALELFGLLPEATYRCVARAEVCGATATTTVHTDPLVVPVRLAAPPGLDDPGAGYVLFNHSRPCAEDRTNRLFVVDPEGRVRWYHELPIDGTSSIDIESQLLADGTILWGGGDEPEGDPQRVGLDGETVYTTAYAGVEEDQYHHDVEWTSGGRILGLVDSDATDGVDDWDSFTLVEHDPETGEVTWRWDAQEAFDRGELPPPEGDHDPWHPNSLASVDDAEGQGVYVSLLDTSEIVRIDRATGRIVWRLGRDGDFALIDGVWFDHLHAVDVFPGPNGDRLFLYDNGNTRRQSRAMALTLDPARREATIDWEWTEPTWYEPNWGDVDQTDAGTVLITMSHAWCHGGSLDHPGAFVEVDELKGDVVARLDFLDADDATYRGQRIDGCSLFANQRYCRP